MKPPIFFLCFANSENHSLLSLEAESENIYRLLSPFTEQQRLQIHREPFATINKITHYLTQFKNSIGVFHYSGHANSQQLFLRNKNIHSAGLAYQLAKQTNLQFVFLNACSTRSQVKLLLELGVPAVIGTTAAVEDDLAVDFSTQFYSAITAGHSIKEAFESASALVVAATNERPRILRAVELMDDTSEDIPWGLYTNSESYINRKLIVPQEQSATRSKNEVIDSDFEAQSTIRVGDTKIAAGDAAADSVNKNIVKNSKMKSGGSIIIGDS